MNKSGKGPNLTWIFIGIAFAIVAITVSMSSYSTFLSDNGVSSPEGWEGVYDNISAEQDSLDSIGNDATSQTNIYKVFEDAAGSTLVVFVTGLSSIGAFFSMGKTASSLLSTAQTAIPGFDALFGLLILVSVIFIVMSLIKARRGVSDTA